MRAAAAAVLLIVGAIGPIGVRGEIRADEKDAGTLVVMDSAGKEIKLTKWKFVLGTRRLGWLGEPAKVVEKKGKKAAPVVPSGPEYLEFREDKTPAYDKDVTTFIPVSSLRKIDYDHDKKAIAVTYLAAGDKELTLVGPSKFANINKFHIDGTVAPGNVSLAGEIKFQDGFLKAGIQGYRFPNAEPVPAPMGRPAIIVVLDKARTVHRVNDPVPIYKVGTDWRAVPELVFQKTVKVPFDKVAKLVRMPARDKKNPALDFEVAQDDGTKQGLTLLEKTSLGENQAAVLVGLVGKVSAGYRLFPAHIIAELRFEDRKDP